MEKKYVEDFRINPSWGVKEFQDHVMRTHNCELSRDQSYRAKRKAINLITGTKEEQFDMLWHYCAEQFDMFCSLQTRVFSRMSTHNRGEFEKAPEGRAAIDSGRY